MSSRQALLDWYDRHRRDLPWRRSRDPWGVWLSEILLQQTRVESAAPYFERLLARFPSPAAIAAAPVEELLALWSGLGYYRRARQLHAAASRVAASGEMPRTAAGLAALPGIGPYTAAAIASIAFDEVVAVLDGNVARVAARLSAEPEEAERPAVRRRLLAVATALLDPARPGDSNQALMELGATVCLPRAPRCAACPLAGDCAARRAGTAEQLPRRRRRPASVALRQVAALVGAPGGRLLLVRRAEGESVMPGLWELPTVEADGLPAAEAALAARYGGRWRLGEPLARARHAITVRRLEVALHGAEWEPQEIAETAAAADWFAPGEAAARALTGVTRKLLAALAASSR
jgi:A/G-specific adenine glycosylase